MTHTINAENLNALADIAPSETLAGTEPDAASQSAEHDAPDDDVEALIISMDRTAAEHLFLQAQRHI